ncbi:hypothetical protein CH365_05150 [Leptospira neocaledonica]|uniref:Uncharacterized protein n=1 Tax=Leptospira neocaledonica TaxID=2023192 RepID=A0A2N0A0I4_9LEPT|nr:hypothetical protein CH365_05150 [Leptospira neocaledonica]
MHSVGFLYGISEEDEPESPVVNEKYPFWNPLYFVNQMGKNSLDSSLLMFSLSDGFAFGVQ